jgi:hypothetical protein
MILRDGESTALSARHRQPADNQGITDNSSYIHVEGNARDKKSVGKKVLGVGCKELDIGRERGIRAFPTGRRICRPLEIRPAAGARGRELPGSLAV